MATINGTTGNDTLTGTAGNDTINPLTGIDTVDGAGGTDLLVIDYSSIGNAVSSDGATFFTDNVANAVSYTNIEHFDITGSSKDDLLITGTGNDTIRGGAGADTLDGGGGIDFIDGGIGTDELRAADFSAAATGITLDSSGASVVAGGLSVVNVELFDTVTGGSGADSITFTTSHADTIIGGAGNDTINPGLGSPDSVDGGAGTDLLVIDYSSLGNAVSSDGATFFTDSVANSVSYTNIERFNVTGSALADLLITGSGNDTIKGGAGGDTLDGASGADSIDGGVGTDELRHADFSASATAVTLDSSGASVSAGGLTVVNVELFDTVTGGSGADSITFTTSHADTVIGGAGNDTINPGLGSPDSVDGGADTDLLVIDYSSLGNAVSSDGATFFTDNVANSVSYTNIERFNVTGSALGDLLITGTGADTLKGGPGSDTLDGVSGADSIDGGAGMDDLRHADFSAAVTGVTLDSSGGSVSIGGMTVVSVELFDTVTGGSGDDSITFTTSHADTINGGAGDDTLNPGLGSPDSVDGGADTDLLVIDYSTVGNPVNSDGATLFSDNVANSVSYSNIEQFSVTGSGFADFLFTSAGTATLKGGVGNDTLTTAGGDDSLDGGAGTDSMTGGTGNDTYVVNSLSDVIVENAGEGTDLVASSITLSFAANPANFANIENLVGSPGTELEFAL